MDDLRVEYSTMDDGTRVATLYLGDVELFSHAQGDDESDAYLDKITSNALWVAKQLYNAVHARVTAELGSVPLPEDTRDDGAEHVTYDAYKEKPTT